MRDYDKALELAKEYKSEPILDLIHWSENYGYFDTNNPYHAFLALAQIEDLEGFIIAEHTTFGYVELDLIGNAVSCYATRPNDVTDFILKFYELESE